MPEANNEDKSKLIKRILLLAGGSLAVYGITKAATFKKVYDQLVVRVTKVKDIDIVGGILGHLRFKTDVLFVNPTNTPFKVAITHIKVLYNGLPIVLAP